jgi:hypothetical protein
VAKGKSRPIWSDSDLLAQFNIYNRKYFGGKLEVARIRFADIGDLLGRTQRFRTVAGRRSASDRFGIQISRSTQNARRIWRMTLFHEMTHVEQRCQWSCDRGGKRFNNRMRELAAAGAFDGIW